MLVSAISYPLRGAVLGAVKLSASCVVAADGAALRVFSGEGARVIEPGWRIDRHALSPCGRYMIACGEDGRRVAAWETATGRSMIALGDSVQRRASLTGSIVALGDDVLILTTERSKPSELTAHALVTAKRIGAFATTAVIGFTVVDVRSLGGTWLGVRGHSDGDQYDTVVAMDAEGLPHLALQDALVDRPSVKEWGYQLAIGPTSAGGVVIYRDAEWDPSDPPDEPDEAFVGFEIWDLQRKEIVQRIPYAGPVPLGADIGADEHRIAVMMSDHALEVSRQSNTTRRIEALALDPFRIEIAYVSGDNLVVAPLKL